MLINKFLFSVLDDDDTITLFKLKDKFLQPKERNYLTFVQDFYAMHKKLPDRATIESKFNIQLIKNTEPADYWFKEIYASYQASTIERAIIDSAKNKGDAIKIFQKAISDYNTDLEIDVTSYDDGNRRIKQYIERKKTKGITYLSTGMTELDVMSLGYKKADLWTIGGRESIGKAEPVSNIILTANRGAIQFGKLTTKDKVFGSDGKPQKVLAIHPQGIRPVYSVNFADGTSVLCDIEHLWSCENRYDRDAKTGYKVRTTKTIMEDLKRNPKMYYKVPNTPAIHYNTKTLDIDPYLLGILLGDGSMTKQNDIVITNNDTEILDYVKSVWFDCSKVKKTRNTDADGLRMRGFGVRLKALGLVGCNSFDKFIPLQYFDASIEQRTELLRGLMDTDGYVVKGNRIAEFSVRSKKLARGVMILARQLGAISFLSKKMVKGAYMYTTRVSFPKDQFINPFKLTRKANIFKHRANNASYGKIIRSIVYSHDEECQCISVSNSDKLYLTGIDAIVTHNTWQLLKMANALDFWMLANNIKRPILIVSGEMTSEELEERLDSIRCSISYQRLSNGTLTSSEERIYERYLKGFESNIIMIDSFDGINDVEFFISLYRPSSIFIDGSHLLAPSYDWKDIAYVTKQMKTITRNHKVPIINTTHLKAERGNSAKGGDLDDFAYTKGYTRDSDIVGVMFASDIMELDNQVGIDWVKVRRGNRSRTVWQSDYEKGTTTLVENLTGKELAEAKLGIEDGNTNSKGTFSKRSVEIY